MRRSLLVGVGVVAVSLATASSALATTTSPQDAGPPATTTSPQDAGPPATTTSPHAAGPPVLAWSPTTTDGTYDFGTIDGVGGKTATQTFTLTNSGDRAPGALTIKILPLLPLDSSAFTITADSCTGTSIGPNPPDNSCSVTVQYAPTTSGQSDTATLAGDGKQASTSITLTGKSGTPDLTLSPGTLGTGTRYGTGKDVNGTRYYNATEVLTTQTFTVTNSATATGTSNALQFADCCNTGFKVINDQTSGRMLAPGETSTFQLTYTAPAGCPTELLATPLVVTSATTSPYISLIYSANCGPPITSVSAALANLTFPGNPQFVSSSPRSDAVNGTLTNHSFAPPAPPIPAGKLHGFTIQIPFSLTAGTLTCDMSASYQPGTCSVSNNVLTVTQNFTGLVPLIWGPNASKQIGYVYVGSSLPGGAYVAWGTPTVTAVR